MILPGSALINCVGDVWFTFFVDLAVENAVI